MHCVRLETTAVSDPLRADGQSPEVGALGPKFVGAITIGDYRCERCGPLQVMLRILREDLECWDRVANQVYENSVCEPQ